MDTPPIEAMIDSIRWFWGRWRCLFLFPSVEIGAANLKIPMVFLITLINYWYLKPDTLPDSYRTSFPCTLAQL